MPRARFSERCDGRLLVVCSVQQWDRNDSSRVAMDLAAIGPVPIVASLDRWGISHFIHLQKRRWGPAAAPSGPLGHAWTGEKRPLFSFGFLVATASCTLAKSKLGPAQTLGTAASRNTDAQELL